MNYQFDFTGKIILITGGNRGLGKEIAKGFASLGGTALLVGRNIEKLQETALEIDEIGKSKCGVYQADVNNDAEIDKMLQSIKAQYGRVDILINNAGVGHRTPSVDETRESWECLLNTNMDTPFFLSAKVAKEFMIPQKYGKIVSTASMGGFMGIPAAAAYSASKGALIQITRSLATEWAAHNIQVNCICPSYIATDLISEAMCNEAWMRLVAIRTPAGRIGKAEEVVGAALFLSSDMASYITGTYIHIDGGAYSAGF